MGVPPFNIASSVILIIAQRLARKLCASCKQPMDIPREALLKAGFRENEVGHFTPYGPVGCDQCTDGYRGRVGIYQVMPISEAMQQIIMRNGNQLELEKQAQKEGIFDLRMSGLKKVKDGVTSLEEIESVTNV
jgi:type IV pilus assembly protein PilB